MSSIFAPVSLQSVKSSWVDKVEIVALSLVSQKVSFSGNANIAVLCETPFDDQAAIFIIGIYLPIVQSDQVSSFRLFLYLFFFLHEKKSRNKA